MERGAWRAAEPVPRVLTPSARPSSGWQSHARDRDWIFKALCGVLNSIIPSQPWQGSLWMQTRERGQGLGAAFIANNTHVRGITSIFRLLRDIGDLPQYPLLLSVPASRGRRAFL